MPTIFVVIDSWIMKDYFEHKCTTSFHKDLPLKEKLSLVYRKHGVTFHFLFLLVLLAKLRVGRLAQLVEHLVYTERVGSSSLSPPTKN